CALAGYYQWHCNARWDVSESLVLWSPRQVPQGLRTLRLWSGGDTATRTERTGQRITARVPPLRRLRPSSPLPGTHGKRSGHLWLHAERLTDLAQVDQFVIGLDLHDLTQCHMAAFLMGSAALPGFWREAA